MDKVIMRQLEVGDKVQVPVEVGNIIIPDFTVEIAEIIYQEPWEWREAYYIDFRDTHGTYRSWRQNFDGGKAILKNN